MLLPNLATIVINNLDKLKETSSVDGEGNLREGFLYEVLKKYNCHLIFESIFKQHESEKEVAIIKTAFLILNYTNKSTWLNFNKDRYINKKENLASLIHDTGIKIDQIHFEIMLRNTDTTLRDVVNYYLESQKSDLFFSLVAYSENIALGRQIAMDNTKSKTIKDVSGITDNLNKLKENQNYFIEMKRQLKMEFSDLDEVTRREGMATFTDDLDLTKYETRLKYLLANPEVLDEIE